jgi:hypothetical protein
MYLRRGEVKIAVRIGESGDPWGVPKSSETGSAVKPLNERKTCRPVRKERIQAQK